MMNSALNALECDALKTCETIIERGLESFCEVGAALLRIRDERLYRASHGTFEEYCRERWKWSRAHAYRQLQAAEVMRNLSPIGDIPQTESQARALAILSPEDQRIAWARAVETAPNGHPTAKHVEQVVSRDFIDAIKRRIAARRAQLEPEREPSASNPTQEELAEVKANTVWASAVMNTIRAVETLSRPPISMEEVARMMRKLDTPDKDWRGQAHTAALNLNQLLKGLP